MGRGPRVLRQWEERPLPPHKPVFGICPICRREVMVDWDARPEKVYWDHCPTPMAPDLCPMAGELVVPKDE
jgi:hypothetical protein